MQQENYGYEVLQLCNSTITIPAKSVGVLQFKFQPLEEKEYEVELPIQIENGDTYFVCFKGKGATTIGSLYHNLRMNAKDDGVVLYLPEVVPACQYLSPIPNQPVMLSLEVLRFGTIPTLSANTQMVIVRNVCQDVIRFNWNPELPKDDIGLLICIITLYKEVVLF